MRFYQIVVMTTAVLLLSCVPEQKPRKERDQIVERELTAARETAIEPLQLEELKIRRDGDERWLMLGEDVEVFFEHLGYPTYPNSSTIVTDREYWTRHFPQGTYEHLRLTYQRAPADPNHLPVVAITISGGDYETPLAVGIGSTLEEIIATLGQPDDRSREPGTAKTVVTYRVPQRSASAVYFVLESDEVTHWVMSTNHEDIGTAIDTD